MTKNIVYAIVIVAAIVAVLFVSKGLRPVNQFASPIQNQSVKVESGRRNLPTPKAARIDAKKTIVVGSDDAPLKIEACIPLVVDCHKKTAAFITKLAKDHPKLIRAEIADMYGPAGKAMQRKYNIKCATIFFNGQSTLELAGEGEDGVYFSGPLDAGYTIKDIALAAQHVLKEQKGEALEIPNFTSQLSEGEND